MTKIDDEIRGALKLRLGIEPGDVSVRYRGTALEIRAVRGGAAVSYEITRGGANNTPAKIAEAAVDAAATLLGVVPRSEDSGVRSVEREALIAGANTVQAEVMRDLVRECARRRGSPVKGANTATEALARFMSAGGDVANAVTDGDSDDLYDALTTIGAHAIEWMEALRKHGDGKRKGAGEVIT